MTTTFPAGWKLVPIEPTIDMVADADEAGNVLGPRARRIYTAMLNAAPAAPGVSMVEYASFPSGAIVNGRVLADRLEAYPFESQGGDLRLCSDWVEFRRCFEYLAEWVGLHAPAAGDARGSAHHSRDREHRAIGQALNRACAELPEGWQIQIELEKGAGTVTVLDPEYCPTGVNGGEAFSDTINEAIDTAFAAQQGKGGEK
ncbi:hypothetical protein [Achromobacter xylosoxidans]|uniref:hypothetical protein n=1 Tax=Alcaligenes xylosoxydans xylosoxydans TaxID=85698 RepID=UPI0003D5DE8E|nr:hypothetical protein [Achromobacter xylosoxidans]AHC48979.1 hypothetical protein AX27061_4521 [Achromobacter xylosoxidans NBRC 15126 = ATCC 27061]QKQ53274.1 hypothetical protein FOC83_10085 [Achromobacter xylosoxidans]QPR97580.1 hypothetical protein I6G72_13945 [Achromobacter xylosoxidans]UON41522.1 hypothetical protein IUJ48_05060 [Achromobacter xylosoxidans]CKH96274.1 Uncharacterised protein [Achromobacter xylosoxidans]